MHFSVCTLFINKKFARVLKVKVKVKSLSCARLFATPWIVACTKLLSPWDFPGKSAGVGAIAFSAITYYRTKVQVSVAANLGSTSPLPQFLFEVSFQICLFSAKVKSTNTYEMPTNVEYVSGPWGEMHK